MSNSSDYILLDSGNCRKLEQVGKFRIVRPALNAFWSPTLPESEWAKADSVFSRRNDGSGSWSVKLPESWIVDYAGFHIKVKPTSFGHLGFFAEQIDNWNYLSSLDGKGKNMLNLFGYSGLASMAMARSGARVCHLDSSAGMIEWGREIQKMNHDVPDSIRWITDDVIKFVRREIRRGSRYDVIALDPPSFGRGSKGEVWKIENDLLKLLEMCREISNPNGDFTLILSCHTPGWSVSVLERMVTEVFGNGSFSSGEMYITESTGRKLPSGLSVTWHKK